MSYNVLRQALIGKRNELKSMEKYIEDKNSLSIIQAKIDTINDLHEMVKGIEYNQLMSKWDENHPEKWWA